MTKAFKKKFEEIINGLYTKGSTNIGDALKLAKEILN